MTWLIVIAMVAAFGAAVLGAIARLRRAIGETTASLGGFGRDVRPALVRVRSANDELRARREATAQQP